jgi:hypothetical protein
MDFIGIFTVDGNVTLRGPMFDGRAAGLAIIAEDHIREALAEHGIALARKFFAENIRNDPGGFLSTITSIDANHSYAWSGRDGTVYTMPVIVSDPAHETVVTTENAMYGPWLEGTGSRNFSTRFKGYHGFRKATQELDMEAQGIAEEVIVPYVRAMNFD